MRELKYYPLTHGAIRKTHHPELNAEIDAQAVVRYLRFYRKVRLDRLTLGVVAGEAGAPMGGSGRLTPDVPTHPAHIVVSCLDRESLRWEAVKEVFLPPNPAIAGASLTQDMSIEEMEERMKKAREEQPPHIIDMGGLVTDHLRVECDREHPVWPSHGEMNGGPYHVPFTILNPLKAYGEELDALREFPYNPILTQQEISPLPPAGMELADRPDMLLFKGKRFSVGFSLRRPILMHLGWDAFGMGKEMENRVRNGLFLERLANTEGFTQPIGLSGPMLRDFSGDYGANEWTGEVSVRGNRVLYGKLKAIEGIEIDAAFTVEQDGMDLELTLRSDGDVPALEFELWRFAWDIRNAMTGAAGAPTLSPGRNGDVALPMFWAGTDSGCLLCAAAGETPTRLQVESYRRYHLLTGGIMTGENPGPEQCLVIAKGSVKASVRFRVAQLAPETGGRVQAGTGVLSRWAAPFACFRPEYGGFSNNSISVNCHMSQVHTVEVVAHTAKLNGGPELLRLARFTVERALLDGGGYGYYRSLFMDSDPSLVSAAGRIHQTEPDDRWLGRIKPGLLAAVRRMLGNMNDNGLLESRMLTGNSGSFRWSTNAMDVISFGHLDAYVNALEYRAFRNAAALLRRLGESELAARCGDAAEGIRRAYAHTFVNPDTGWVAGWRSRDGALHDYAFLWINGVAITFGLLEDSDARAALTNLEQLRNKLGIGSARLGLPLNLLPIRPEDHLLPRIFGDHARLFENYTDGALAAVYSMYYLRALSIYGLSEQAKRLAKDLDEGLLYGMFDGANYTGREFCSWEGLPNGYEGTMATSFGCLYAIAVEQGAIEPSQPEWWPE